MIQINHLQIGFEFKDATLTQREIFEYVVIKQTVFGYIPTIELSINVTDLKFLKNFKAYDPLIFKIGYVGSLVSEYKFSAINYTVSKSDTYRFNIVISGILDLRPFTHYVDQVSYGKTTLSKAYKSLKGVKPIIETESNDTQIWLRYNIPEKAFVDKTIPYMATESAPIYGVRMNSTLKVTDMVKELKNEPKLSLSLDDKSMTQISSYRMESDNALSYFFSSGSETPVVNPVELKPYYFNNKGGVSKEKDLSGKQFGALLDCGNTHNRYYQTYGINIGKWNELSENLLIIDTPSYIPESVAGICDNFYIKIDDLSDIVSEKQLLLDKHTVIEKEAISTRLMFGAINA